MIMFKDLSEEELLKNIKEDAYRIRYVVNPTEEMQLEAVSREGYEPDYRVGSRGCMGGEQRGIL